MGTWCDVNCLFIGAEDLNLKSTKGFGSANKRRSDHKCRPAVVSGPAVHIVSTHKKKKRRKGSNLLKVLSLKHLNNLALNIIKPLDYFRDDNKRALTPQLSLSLSASLLMEIVAYFAGKVRQSVRKKERGKHNEMIRNDLTQRFPFLSPSLKGVWSKARL